MDPELPDILPEVFERYVDPDGNTRLRRTDDSEVCDFCCYEAPAWSFPAAEVALPEATHIDISDDDWAACDSCKKLIAAAKPHQLVERMIDGQRKAAAEGDYMLPAFVIRPRLMKLVLRFFEARTGPPIRT